MRPHLDPKLAKMEETLDEIRRSSRPVIVGPWLTEVGFETLYWIPFLRWAVHYAEIDPARLLIVSRGGVADWYADLGGRYVEIFDLMSVGAFRRGNDARVIQQNKIMSRQVRKQFIVGDFDREVIAAVEAREGLAHARRPLLLHPSLMYARFRPYWRSHRINLLDIDRARFVPFQAPPPHGLDLPAQYTAVKFYASTCFPDTPKQRAFVQQMIACLAERTNVVLLETGRQFDDHADLVCDLPSVYRLTMTAANNLQVQTRVMAGAERLVSTYGGFSYVGPMLGVPTTSYYGTEQFLNVHLRLATKVFQQPGFGAFTAELVA